MKFKIYALYSANTNLLPPEAKRDIIHPVASMVVIEVGMKFRQNLFDSVEEAMQCIAENPEFKELRLTILPHIEG